MTSMTSQSTEKKNACKAREQQGHKSTLRLEIMWHGGVTANLGWWGEW